MPYQYSERTCDLRIVGLDKRLFTSPHTMELLRYGGPGPPVDPMILLRLQLRKLGSFRCLGSSLTVDPYVGTPQLILCISSGNKAQLQ